MRLNRGSELAAIGTRRRAATDIKPEFGIRIWAGMLLRLSPAADGKSILECWLKERKIWKPCGLMDKYLESKPATAAEIYAAGLSVDGTASISKVRRATRRS